MSARPHISVKDKVTVAIAQAAGGHIYCPLCRKPLHPEEPRILEHMVVRAFTNSDETKYLAWVHKACADLKTYGGKATCADGDIHKIAKARRIAKAREIHHAIVQKVMAKPVGKIRSRGFDKTRTKRFSGQVEKRG